MLTFPGEDELSSVLGSIATKMLHEAGNSVVENEAGNARADVDATDWTLHLARHPAYDACVAERMGAGERHRSNVQLTADTADELVLENLLQGIHSHPLFLKTLQLPESHE